MHVVELLEALLLGKDIEGDKPPLPDAVVGMVMYGGRQAQGSEQGAWPREIALRAQRFQDRKRTALFYILDNRRSRSRGQRLQQQMKISGIRTQPINLNSNFERAA